MTFVAPASKVYVSAETLAGLDLHQTTRVDYVAARDRGKDPAKLDTWHVYEDTMALAGPRKGPGAEAASGVRALQRPGRRRGDGPGQETRPGRRRPGPADALGSRHYPDVAAVEARLATIGKTRRVAAYPRTSTGTDPDTGKPILNWHFDQQTIDAEAASDGWYALLTNLDPDEADPTQVLLHYKGQEAVERRYSTFKGPLAVAAIYLKDNRRITAMITVICLALLIFSLIERQVRGALRAQGWTTIDGLYAGRPAVPTTRLIFQALASMRVIPAAPGSPHTIPQPAPLQLEILDLLDVNSLEWC